MFHAQHIREEDEDKALRITFYLVFALALTISVGLLVYTILP
jgi:hypothetical protein